jgi:FkbM family methyltransferase
MKRFSLPDGLKVWSAPDSLHEMKFIHQENFIQHGYEKHGVCVHNGDVVFDVGANIGLFALSLMGRFGNLRIYCFEPVPATHACLVRNLAESPHRAKHEVRAFDVGLGAADGEITIQYYPGAPANSTIYSEGKRDEFGAIVENVSFGDAWRFARWKAVVYWPLRKFTRRLIERAFDGGVATSCRLRTLSGIIRESGVERIDLLKIDVEGAEMDVLEGIEDAHWPLIRQVSMEISPAQKPAVPALVDRLRARGFRQSALESMFGSESRLDDPIPCNLFAVR